MSRLEEIHSDVTSSLERHRFKEALRSVMTTAQLGNQMLQSATPWKYLKDLDVWCRTVNVKVILWLALV